MMLPRTPLLRWVVQFGLGIAALSLFSPPLFAQENMRDLMRVVNQMYGDASAATDENFAKFDRFFIQFYFPEFAKEANAPQLPTMRYRFFREQVMRARQQQVHDRLIQLALNEMKKIVENKQLSPAVRCNAMLIIGELNDQERAMRAPPVPMSNALSYMVDQFNAPDQIDSVRVAAMTGILRHVQMEKIRSSVPIPNTLKGTIAQAMMALAQAEAPPAGRTPNGHAWMRGRALEILSEMGAANQPQVASLLVQVAGDVNAPLFLRCTAAEVLGKNAMTAASGLKGDQAATALAKLAVDVYNAESKRVETYQQQGVGLANPVDTRRRLKYRFGTVYSAMGGADGQHGIASLAAGNQTATTIQNEVKQIYTTVEGDSTSTAEAMLNNLKASTRKLADAAGAGAAPATPPTGDGPGTDTPPADVPAADVP